MIGKEQAQKIKHDLQSISSDIEAVVDCITNYYEDKETSLKLLKSLQLRSEEHNKLVVKSLQEITQSGGIQCP